MKSYSCYVLSVESLQAFCIQQNWCEVFVVFIWTRLERSRPNISDHFMRRRKRQFLPWTKNSDSQWSQTFSKYLFVNCNGTKVVVLIDCTVVLPCLFDAEQPVYYFGTPSQLAPPPPRPCCRILPFLHDIYGIFLKILSQFCKNGTKSCQINRGLITR